MPSSVRNAVPIGLYLSFLTENGNLEKGSSDSYSIPPSSVLFVTTSKTEAWTLFKTSDSKIVWEKQGNKHVMINKDKIFFFFLFPFVLEYEKL